MTYVMSDIHGQLDKFLAMLETIHFSDDDVLYVLGDVADRGPAPAQCYLKMMEYANIIPIAGNHDWMALSCMPFLFREITDESVDRVTGEELELVRQWLRNGCMTTIQDLKACTQEERQDILEYIESFQLFEELTINNQAYVLVHGGLEHFDPDKPLEAYGPEDLLWTRTDYTKVYYPDKILVTGHTPTQLIGVGEPGRIYQGNNHIALDCGAAFGADLGCLCLETKEEFYI